MYNLKQCSNLKLNFNETNTFIEIIFKIFKIQKFKNLLDKILKKLIFSSNTSSFSLNIIYKNMNSTSKKKFKENY